MLAVDMHYADSPPRSYVRDVLLAAVLLSTSDKRQASLSSLKSLSRGPTMPSPTGNPSTRAHGMDTCGKPARPAMDVRAIVLALKAFSFSAGVFFTGAGPGADGRVRKQPGSSSCAMCAVILHTHRLLIPFLSGHAGAIWREEHPRRQQRSSADASCLC